MNKYKLNVLRWLTRGEIPDEELKTAHDFKIKKGRFSFKFKAKVDMSTWRWGYGRIEK